MIISETVKVTITSNIKYYRNLGYNVRGWDIIEIPVEHLPKGSHINVEVECDICGEKKEISYRDYLKNIEKYDFYTCNNKCSKIKVKKTLFKKTKNLFPENHKRCLKCNEIKLFDNFNKHKSALFGFSSKCKKCKHEEYLENKKKERKEKGFPEGCRECRNCKNTKSIYDFDKNRTICKICISKLKKEKKCSNCGKIKPLNQFRKSKYQKPSGVQSKCKECSKKPKKLKEVLQEGFKRCTKCKEVKTIDKFSKNQFRCKSCCKEWRKENEEYLIKYGQKHYQKNKERISVWSKEYRQRPETKERKNKNTQKDRKENPHIYSWRSVLINALDRLGQKKEGHTIDLLKYSAIDLRDHIKNLFIENMSWDNHGEWHIDHIIPVARFKKETLPHIVNSLENLQPLWDIRNLSKRNKILIHEEKSINLYLKYRPYLKEEVIKKYDKLLTEKEIKQLT